MNAHLSRALLAAVLALASSRAADAACSFDRLRPSATLPTLPTGGQTFTFVATNDCASLEFTTDGNTFTKTPTMTHMAGGGSHFYEVDLSPMEWRSVTGPGVTVFHWRIRAIDTSTPSSPNRFVLYTNELDLDRDGWSRSEGDAGACDRSPDANPGATELCDNDVDDDCDGQVDECQIVLDDADAVVSGSVVSGLAGATLAFADVNGDGVGDLLIGAPGDENDAGHAYVSFGPLSGTVHTGDDITITPDLGPRGATRPIGESIAGGDANGDGYDDVLVSAWSRGVAAFLLLGPITGDVSTSDADLELTPSLNGVEQFGFHMQIVPNIGHDGGNDIVITAPGGSDRDGNVYVVRGTQTGHFESGGSTYGFWGPADGEQELGISTTDLGDTNGDGSNDLAISTRSAAYVVPGGLPPGPYGVRTIQEAQIRLQGHVWYAENDNANLASVDYDDDGYRDLLVGDPYANEATGEGAVHLLAGPFSGSIDAGPDDVVTWRGHGLGYLVDVGDFNGDDTPDYLLGGSGVAYLGFGPEAGVVEAETLVSLPGGGTPEGALLFGPDWSGDGAPEIVIGDKWAATDGGSAAGAAYVFYSDVFE